MARPGMIVDRDGTVIDDVGYIPGVSGSDACHLVSSDESVAAVGQLLRRYHDAVAEWRPEVPPVWFDGQVGTGVGDQLVCHGDVGPWNLVWRDGELVGLIDWEYATIGTRREDIAYALHYLAPTPKIVFFPVMIMWFGVGPESKIAMGTLSC